MLDEHRSNRNAAAAELALKSYIAESTPEILAQIPAGGKLMQELRAAVNLTEAPEDAVCSLVVDLMHYWQRERIEWAEDIVRRARRRFQSEHTHIYAERGSSSESPLDSVIIANSATDW